MKSAHKFIYNISRIEKKNVDPVAMGGHHFMCALKNVDALYAILFTILWTACPFDFLHGALNCLQTEKKIASAGMYAKQKNQKNYSYWLKMPYSPKFVRVCMHLEHIERERNRNCDLLFFCLPSIVFILACDFIPL